MSKKVIVDVLSAVAFFGGFVGLLIYALFIG